MDLGIFTIGDIEEGVCYHLNWDEDVDKDIAAEWLMLFGVVIGKAIFERIPMQGLLDRVILRHLIGDNVKIEDIYGHDKQVTFLLCSCIILGVFFKMDQKNRLMAPKPTLSTLTYQEENSKKLSY